MSAVEAVFVAPQQLSVPTRKQFKEEVLAGLGDGPPSVVIDFSGCGYVDSAGLGALVRLSKSAKDRGARLRVRGLSPDLRNLFRLTRMDSFLEIADD